MVNHFLHISANSPSISPPSPFVNFRYPCNHLRNFSPSTKNSSTRKTSILPLPGHILPPLPRPQVSKSGQIKEPRHPETFRCSFVQLAAQLVSNFRKGVGSFPSARQVFLLHRPRFVKQGPQVFAETIVDRLVRIVLWLVYAKPLHPRKYVNSYIQGIFLFERQ